MRILQGDGFILEPQCAAHAQAMFAVLCDPAIYVYENAPPPSLEWLRERFARLESRRSADGSEDWLNWVVRLPSGELAGYVQATVRGDGNADIAYVLASAYWGRGLAQRAVASMLDELVAAWHVHTAWAVFKANNVRSERLLGRLHFAPATEAACQARPIDPDEGLYWRSLGSPAVRAG